MNLMRNSEAKHIDFRDFKGLIDSNPRAVPCNLDMIFERKGYFFVGEWKRANERLSTGQEILLKALAREHKFVVILIVGSQSDDFTDVADVFRIMPSGKYETIGKSLEDLKEYVSMWYDYANDIGVSSWA